MSQLQVGILPAGEDPAFPDPNATADTALPEYNRVIYKDDRNSTIAFERAIRLSAPQARPLFLVLPKSVWGIRITRVDWQYRMKDINGNPEPEVLSGTARPADSKDRYSIQFKELFKDTSRISSEQLQSIHIELQLSDGTEFKFDITMHAYGELAAIPYRIEERPVSEISGAPTQIMKSAIENGIGIVDQVLKNTTSRPLQLWYRLKSSQVQFWTFFWMPGHEEDFIKGPKKVSDWPQLSRASLNISRESGGMARPALTDGAWRYIVLQPNQEVRISWAATFAPGNGACANPRRHRSLRKFVADNNCMLGSPCFNCFSSGDFNNPMCRGFIQTENVEEPPAYAGVRVAGEFSREFRIAESFVPPLAALAEKVPAAYAESVLALVSGSYSFNWQVGEVNMSGDASYCPNGIPTP